MNPEYLKQYYARFQPDWSEFDMNTTKITSIASATEEVKNRNFIVGSVNAIGALSVSTNPATHLRADSARTEAKRLARAEPGKMFVILQLMGAELVPTNTLSI